LHPGPLLRAIAALSDNVSGGFEATTAFRTLPDPPDVVLETEARTFDETTPLIALCTIPAGGYDSSGLAIKLRNLL